MNGTEIVQICGISNYFVITGVVLSGLWAGAYILSWLVQWAWAWVDEAEVANSNWIVSKTRPIVNEYSYKDQPDGWMNTDSHTCWRYKKYKDGAVIAKTDTNPCFYPWIIFLIWFSMLCLNFWYISMYFGLFFAIAFSTRMARRGQKVLAKHIADKDAHKD